MNEVKLSEMIENWEKMEKWGDEKDFNFSHLCVGWRVEKWMNRK